MDSSKIKISHCADFEQAIIKISHFADLEKVIIKLDILLTLNKLSNTINKLPWNNQMFRHSFFEATTLSPAFHPGFSDL